MAAIEKYMCVFPTGQPSLKLNTRLSQHAWHYTYTNRLLVLYLAYDNGTVFYHKTYMHIIYSIILHFRNFEELRLTMYL